MRLALLVPFLLSAAACDLVTDPDGPQPEDFEYEIGAGEATPAPADGSTIARTPSSPRESRNAALRRTQDGAFALPVTHP